MKSPRRSSKPQLPRKPALAQPPQLVEVEKPIYGGAFLARHEGKAVFVPLALPGEQARIRIVDDKKGYATAEVEAIVRSAPERIEARCAHFGICGGCNYQHVSYETQLQFKQAILRETLERGGVRAPEEITVLAGEPWGYRNRIRLAFDAQGSVGYRGRRSHAIVPIHECPIAAPLLVDAGLKFAQVAREFAQSIHLTEVSLSCNGDESALIIGASSARESKHGFEEFGRALKVQLPVLAGMEIVIQGREGHPQRTLAQWGESAIAYHAAGFEYRVDHGAFFQVNRCLVDELVNLVTHGRSGTLAWDLYAGVGLFSRKLADGFERVVAVESATGATAALEHNLEGMNATAVNATTLAFLQRSNQGSRPDLIVVDPPRTGLGAEITSLLANVGAPEMVYVSCDPATLARDLRTLIEYGYEIESVTLADLFPQTFHLETVVHLLRPGATA
jgi:23S rRNA (uracil1939-C5)-methyltransferase